MALTLGQCCIFGTAFNSECAASGPCGRTLPRGGFAAGPSGDLWVPNPQRFGPECVASVPCECANNITSTGVTQAESDEPLPKRLADTMRHAEVFGGAINTQADFRCCMWAGGTYSVKSGCGQDGGYHKVIDPTSGNRDLSGNETDPQLLGNEADPRIWAVFREIAADTWGPICEYGGAGGGNFVNCQLSCYRNGFIPDGWEAACVKQPPSSPPGLPSWPSSPPNGGLVFDENEFGVGIWKGRFGAALPFKAGVQPLEFDASLTRMCCPSGSTYDPHEFVGAECVGDVPAGYHTSDVMKVAAITCSCRDLCNRTAVSGSRVYSGCSDRVTADEDSHADLCDRWASALRPEPLGPRASDSITAFLDGWKLLCSASDGTFDGFSGQRLLVARQTWSVSAWSKCMYSCHLQSFTPDQWNTQCVWPSPPPPSLSWPPLSAPLALSLDTPLPLRSLPPDSPSDGCGSGCVGSILGGIMLLIVVLYSFLVRRFYPGTSFWWLCKWFAKGEDRQQRRSLRTDDLSLQVLSPLNEHYAHALGPLSASGSFPETANADRGVSGSTALGVLRTDPPSLMADVRMDGTATAANTCIPARHIVRGVSIGSGGMGEVFKATWNGSTNVAVKVVKRNRREDEASLQSEATVLSQLRHPRLVAFLGTTFTEDGGLGIVMEYMSKGSLYALLDLGGLKPEGHRPHNKVVAWAWAGPEATRFRIAQEIAAGIDHLHRKEFMHRDVKTEK